MFTFNATFAVVLWHVVCHVAVEAIVSAELAVGTRSCFTATMSSLLKLAAGATEDSLNDDRIDDDHTNDGHADDDHGVQSFSTAQVSLSLLPAKDRCSLGW